MGQKGLIELLKQIYYSASLNLTIPEAVELDDVHAAEIKAYLDLLDLTRDIPVRHLPDVSETSNRTVIAQPGLRYAQADALIRSLLLDEAFSALSLSERTAVQGRILNEIKGRMLKDIVLLEATLEIRKSRPLYCNSPCGVIWWCSIQRPAPARFLRSSTARKQCRSSIGI